MKTTILEQLEVPDEVMEVARRQAMHREVPVTQVLAEWVLEKAKALVAADMKRKATREPVGI